MNVELLILLPVFLGSVILHEVSHGWVAFALGDGTAREEGRLTLNPLAHLDPVGTVLFPVLMKLLGLPVFGWARPVPVNFSRLRSPRRDMMLVGLAGPGANLLVAVWGAAVHGLPAMTAHPLAREVLTLVVLVNLMLAVFNLIPIPPLDGSRFVLGLLQGPLARWYAHLERYGVLLLVGLLALGLTGDVVVPIVQYLATLLLGE